MEYFAHHTLQHTISMSLPVWIGLSIVAALAGIAWVLKGGDK
jgi:hypothetical protein